MPVRAIKRSLLKSLVETRQNEEEKQEYINAI